MWNEATRLHTTIFRVILPPCGWCCYYISVEDAFYFLFQWPERIYQCESGVTALDFCTSSPNLLAVGMYNGTVAIYNVQNKENVPVLDSRYALNNNPHFKFF